MKQKAFLRAAVGVGLALVVAVAPAAYAALTPEEQNTINIINSNLDSVVYITNVRLASGYSFNDLEVPRGTGSGFLWDANGHVVTNYHVVQGGDAFYVTLHDQSRLKAKVVGAEPRKDLAVLKIDPKEAKKALRPVSLGDSGKLQVGQKTLAIGNPYGLDYTVTTGIVSALGRKIRGVGDVTIYDVIQTDASINPGNSGGPLLDSGGDVIGMNTAIFSESGSSAGIGFAVPAAFIKKLVPQIIKHGKVIQPGLGISVVRDDLARQVTDQKGAIVSSVEPNSPAHRAGIRGLARDRFGRFMLGDIIVAIDERRVASYDDLYNTLDRYNVGDKVSVTVQRGEQEVRLSVTLQAL